jgi:hypothetical protein
MSKKKLKSKCFDRPKRFFAYYKAGSWDQIDKQRVHCQDLVRESGGLIADDAVDVGPGIVVDMPGYARLFEALERPTVDAFVADFTAFGPTLILGLYAVCVVSGVEMWDMNGGRISTDQLSGIRDVFLDQLDKRERSSEELIGEMLSPCKFLS